MDKIAIIVPQNAPAYAKVVEDSLLKRSFEVNVFTWNNFESNNVFEDYSTVILADAGNCPAFMATNVDEFLSSGGNIVTLGGPPFANEFYNINNKEIDIDGIKSMMMQNVFEKETLLAFDSHSSLAGFRKDTFNPDSKKYDGNATLSIVKGGCVSAHCLRYFTDDFVINESFEHSITIKEGHNVIGFYAKALQNTKTITMVLIQKNGDIYKTRVTPTTSYEYFLLSKRDFIFSGNRSGNSRSSQYVDFSQVSFIQFGLALSHAYSVAGEHAFFIDELSTACVAVLNDNTTVIDGLCPEYKFYPVTNCVTMKSYCNQAFVSPCEWTPPSDLFSFSPRPQSTGIDKQRRFRFVPLIEAYDEKELRCGYAAYMLLNFCCGERKSKNNKSTIIAFTTNDNIFYQNGGANAVCEAIASLYQPAILLEGGSNEYVYFEDEKRAILGAVVLVRDSAQIQVKFEYRNTTFLYDLDELCIVPNDDGLDLRLIAFEDTPCESRVCVSLLRNDVVCDTLSHDILIHVDKPQEERKFASINENEVIIDGKPTRFFGVNYMPTSNIGLETGEEFEHYVAGFAYDPDIIGTDLKRIRDVGLNAVSLFMHYNPSIQSYNILHLVELCQRNGLYVDLSIRPNANPFSFNRKEISEMITKYRFENNDNIVAYDIAWERYVGTYDVCYGNFNGRKSFDKAWREYILNRYGSVEIAQAMWGVDIPQNKDGEIIGVSDDMLREDGAHNAMVAAFRNFIDNTVAYHHIKAVEYIKSLDPNHLISARTGDASTIPLVDPGIYGYDYKSLSSALDFMSPESYALTDNYSNMRQGVFTNVYARYANPNNVTQWKEFGKSIWTGSNFIDNGISEGFQAEYYRRFFQMLLTGHTSGLYAWWWAGGYRVGEISDFGIIGPDGSDRPVTTVFREYADKFLNAPLLKKSQKQFFIDRDTHADGLKSVYLSIEQELFGALEGGVSVELVDGGSGFSSVDVPLTEVGNLPENGCNPKFLDAVITDIIVEIENKLKLSVRNNDGFPVVDGERMTISVTVINTQSTRWIGGNAFGSVCLRTLADTDYQCFCKQSVDIGYLGHATYTLNIEAKKGTTLSFALEAKDRTYFGERIHLKLL